MDFDEYDYLEKTVEETNGPPSKTKETKDSAEKERDKEKGYRRKERRDEDEGDIDEDERDRKNSSSKRSRGDDENGRDRDRERERDRDREKERSSRHRSRERESERSSRDRDRDKERREKERDRDRERDRERRDRDKEKEREKDRDRDQEREKDKDKDRERRDREKDKEIDREGEGSRDGERSKESERSRRSRSRSRLDRERERELIRERERELEMRESRRFKEKKEAVEPEADPERDQRTVFAYQMPLKATERNVYEFFSKAGKVRDVRLIMDRNSRRSKGVGYIEFFDSMSVPMAIALSGHLLLGQPVMVKPSEAEKNLVPSNASSNSNVVGPYGATDRKLYVGNLHFNMTEFQLKQIFEAFGPVELVQLPTDPETGHCKGFGFVQFAQLEHAKAAQVLNGKLEIAGRTIKVSSVTDHVGVQDSGQKTADFDDDDGGGLALNAQSRAMLMAKLDRSGIASSVAGSLGVPALNGATPAQQTITMPMVAPTAISTPVLPAQVLMPPEPIGNPSECLLLKNMFDSATESDLEFDLDIRDDVREECSKYGPVKHIHVDKNSAGYVYLRFENVEAAARAQQAMHKRWFARRLISAIFLQPYEYDAKFKGAA